MLTVETADTDGQPRVIMDGDLTFATVGDAHTALSQYRGSEIGLELRDLGAIDLAGLQLLYAAAQSTAPDGPVVTLVDTPAMARFRAMAEYCGLPPLGTVPRG
tara:strand:- start:1184 stop:1492 length:309 start_codon:yes stop_codon:yes gene_type:complete